MISALPRRLSKKENKMIKDYTTPLKQVKSPLRKPIKKRGTVKISTVETTPVIFKGELLRFE